MKLFISATLAAALLCTTASAQQRLPNAGTASVLRIWPRVGAWEVVLSRLIYGDLGCGLRTGQANKTTGETYIWGFRWREHEGYALVVIDNNQRAVAGANIRLFIDQIPIGYYPIVRRLGPENGFHSIVADLPPGDQDKIISLIRVGGGVQFVTDTFTYSASLTGAAQGMTNMDACIIEATHLNPSTRKDPTSK